jgi:hypothetical protein
MKPEDVQKIWEEDQKKLRAVDTAANDLTKSITDRAQKKCQTLKDKIRELIEKKREVLNQPHTKAELLEMAKDALREHKKEFFDEMLASHLRDCQNPEWGHILAPLHLRMFFRPGDEWKLIYWIITEEDIEKAMKTLPDIGLSTVEKNAEIKKLDTEIAAIEDQIGKELKKL